MIVVIRCFCMDSLRFVQIERVVYKIIVEELKSWRFGLVGGIQLALYGDGITWIFIFPVGVD